MVDATGSPEIALEIAGCPVCGSSGTPYFERQADLLCGIGGEFGQRHCPACQLYFLSPRVPERDIDRYYPDDYPGYREDNHPRLIRRLAWALGLVARRRRIVERFLRGGRILDVGCGNGFFLRTLAGGAWQRYAMDTNWYGGGDCPGEFHEGRFDCSPPPLTELDAVTLWHVFEHLYHPQRALEHAAAILKPGGFLFLAIPDLRSPEPRLFGKYWIGWDPPRHIATYSRRGLETLLGRAGFQLVGTVPDAYTGEVVLLSVTFLLRSLGFRRPVPGALVFRLVLAPVVFILSRLGLSSVKVYVARYG